MGTRDTSYRVIYRRPQCVAGQIELLAFTRLWLAQQAARQSDRLHRITKYLHTRSRSNMAASTMFEAERFVARLKALDEPVM